MTWENSTYCQHLNIVNWTPPVKLTFRSPCNHRIVELLWKEVFMFIEMVLVGCWIIWEPLFTNAAFVGMCSDAVVVQIFFTVEFFLTSITLEWVGTLVSRKECCVAVLAVLFPGVENERGAIQWCCGFSLIPEVLGSGSQCCCCWPTYKILKHSLEI